MSEATPFLPFKDGYLGRPCGIGNRLHEVGLLIAVSKKYGKSMIDYVWNNRDGWRKYNAPFTAGQTVRIIEPDIHSLAWKQEKVSGYKRLDFNAEMAGLSDVDLYSACSNIKPNFQSMLPNLSEVIGVHIRGGDRISTNNNPDFTTPEESENIFNRSIEYFNDTAPENAKIFICSDDAVRKVRFIANLRDDLRKHFVQLNNQSVWTEFFALSQCKEIHMLSSFSSFTIMAAMIGGRAVKVYQTPRDEGGMVAYKARVELI